ncbi:MAG: hypothetical protein J5847_01690 [Clostridia bacterium]|nr:hypothetical protein [Clostridia bacterium]MBR5753250.1 hypothetical protein [Clostridia bacterium]
MALSKETYRELYRKLDEVTPVPYDCGVLCGKACCGVSGYDRAVEDGDMGLYLYPGEEDLQKEDPDWLRWSEEQVEEEDITSTDEFAALFPPSFLGKELSFVKCKDPMQCHREHRPLQCRLFPTQPHLLHAGKRRERLVLILNDMDLPYTCPLIEEEPPLSQEWLKTVYEVWEVLLTDPLVHDMVALNSLEREHDVGQPTVLWPRARRKLN